MKIIMVFPDISSEKGISMYSSDLIKNLRKRNIEVEEMTYIQHKPITLLKKIFKLEGIVHIQHEYNLLGFFGIPFLFIYLYFLFTRLKIITTFHTVISQESEFEGRKSKNFLRKKFYKIQNWLIKKSSQRVIVHSDYFRDILVNEYKFREEKVITLPHAIRNVKTISKKEARKKLGLSGNVYLMIGTLNPYHDYESIVRQADKIGKTIMIVTNAKPINYRNVDVLLRAFESLEMSVDDFKKFVKMDTSHITSKDKKWWEYFSACDLVLLPYKPGVGCGIFADAMAVKRPVIGTAVPYFTSIEKNYGCIKTTEDFPKAIKEAMKSSNYKKMLEECERYVQGNGLTSISKKYKKLYEGLV